MSSTAPAVIVHSKKLLSYPSRLLARIRRFHAFLDESTAPAFNSVRIHDFEADSILAARSPPPSFTPLPGPWGFLTSGYIVGLIIMAVLMHRIQNIVVPPRHRIHRVPRPQNRHRSFLQAIYRTIFPLDFSSSLVRLILRLPSLYFLSKSLLLWIITLAQTVNMFPVSYSRWLQSLGTWVAQQETASLCWFTFCSVCGALCVEALNRGLEGSNSSASPFNLFGYAFLLHIYSSPMTHGTKLEGVPSRPDQHVIFTIILPLLQLVIVHCLGIRQVWSNHRLLPSAIVSTIALAHFHWVLWFSDSTYPLLNYMPCLFESVLLSVTSLAIFLNVLTQIVTEGSVTRPLFGHHAALLPRLDEDFSVALLRIGTASLETSSVAGFGNEVGGVAVMPPSLGKMDVTTVELSRFGVSSISHPYLPYGNKRKAAKGFANEIKNVKAASSDGDLWLDLAWYREFVRFAVGVARFLKGLYILSRDFVKRRPHVHPTPSVGTQDTPSSINRSQSQEDDQDIYGKFIRGEQLSDDEYDEYEPALRSRSNSSNSLSSSSDNREDSVYDDSTETVGLYADLASTDPTSTSASHLLAHLADDSTAPLTRRRFSQLISGSSSNPARHRNKNRDEWMEVIQSRRPAPTASRTGDLLDDARRNCVICTVEPRQIICWPCRCLSLCDDCRENLASRSSAVKHTCPCCRTSVEGYSKIYIP